MPPAPSVSACGRTKSADYIAIIFTIPFIAGTENLGRTRHRHRNVMDMLNEYTGPLQALVILPGGRAPGVAATSQERGPPPSQTRRGGRLPTLTAAQADPYRIPLVLTNGTYRNFLIALWTHLLM